MNKVKISWDWCLQKLSKIDVPGNIVYGIPKGGMILAGFLKNAVNTNDPNEANIILDDIIDSGETIGKYIKKYPNATFFALVNKKTEKDSKDIWFEFPWETDHPGLGEESIHENIVRVLQYIGEDPKREGLIGTPDRVVRMYSEIFRGYDISQKPKVSIFKNGLDGIAYDQMILDEGEFHSHCEHHMVPFYGKYYFGYLPSENGNIIGLSKVARLVDYHSAKLQIQERLVHDIVEDIWQELCKDGAEEPLGMGLVMVGEHLCKRMRGVKKKGQMTTIKLKGRFLEKPEVKQEFLNRCGV